jgi:DNA-binding NarL/FixJ family response regulator
MKLKDFLPAIALDDGHPQTYRSIAAGLRAMADQLDRRAEIVTEKQRERLRRPIANAAAGRYALALKKNGRPEDQAITIAALKFRIGESAARSSLTEAESQARHRDARRTLEELQRLRSEGLTIRQIAAVTKLAKSTVADRLNAGREDGKQSQRKRPRRRPKPTAGLSRRTATAAPAAEAAP